MSLVYLITGLPQLRRDQPSPLPRAEFVRRCRDLLEGPDLAELELMLRIEAVEETIRLDLETRLRGGDADDALTAIITQRSDGADVEQLPEWVLRPALQHELMRRHYFELTREAQTEFLRGWANFRVDIGEISTAALAKQQGLSRDAFLEQMLGSFDASAPLILRHWEEPDLGLGRRFSWLPTVMAALADDDLMAMSRTLDDVAWDKIESMQPLELFSVETLLATYLKLRILEREASWDAEAGAEVLARILTLPPEAGLTA